MKVMLATDGSACARAALVYAQRVLPLKEMELVAVAVAPMPSPFVYSSALNVGAAPDVYYGELLDLAEKEAAEALLGAKEVLGDRARLVQREGDPAREILDVARHEQPDLIILGSHGRGMLGRALLGSVSTAILHQWTGAVMVVREATCTAELTPELTLGDVMTTVLVVAPEDLPLHMAARMMAEADVGAVPVMRDGHLVGILTDRDIVVRAIARDADPHTATVGAFCTRGVACGEPGMRVSDAVRLMESRKIRRLPVLDEDRLVGFVSLGDLAESAPRRAEEVLVEVSKSPSTLAHVRTPSRPSPPPSGQS